MVNYIQLNQDNSFQRKLLNANVEWDPTHFCRPDQLTLEEATYFKVFPLTVTDWPEINNITHYVMHDGVEWSNAGWRTKWKICEFTPEEVTENLTKAAHKSREEAKALRATAVDNITVTTSSGNTFDGDEISQTRMARAILVLQATGTPSMTWVLSNNTPVTVTVGELTEALALSGAAQAAIWVL